MKRHLRGFTLIELLVVIAIIGVLSTVVMASLAQARGKARDATRQTDLKQLATALELYYDKHDSYPVTGPTTWATSADGGEWIPGLVSEKFIAGEPVDPQNGQGVQIYSYSSVTGSGYALQMWMENTTLCDNGYQYAGMAKKTRTVFACRIYYNPGGATQVGP